MRRIFILIVVILFTLSVRAQSPQKVSYQAVIRNSSDAIIANTKIGMEINIRQATPMGVIVYSETQTPTTNANGLVSLEIGAGITNDEFSAIDWSNGPYFIEIKTALIAPLTNYTITGTFQLLSVPYALHANSADSIVGGINETDPVFTAWDKNFNDLTNKPTLFNGEYSNLIGTPTLFSGSFADLTNKPITIAGYGITDAFDGNYNNLTNKPALFSGSYNDLINKPTLFNGEYSSLIGTPIIFSGSFADLINKPTTIAGYGITDAFDGNYNNLTNKPALFSGSYNDLINKPTLFNGEYSSLIGVPILFSGSFADLTNKPTTIAGYGITDAFDGNYNNLTNKPTIDGSETNLSAGVNTSITGAGTSLNPYVINSNASGSNYSAGSGVLIAGHIISAKDTSSTNELQTISISNDTIYLSNGGFVKLPSLSASVLLPPVAVATSASDLLSNSVTLNGIVNGKGLSSTVVFEWGLTTSYGGTVNANQSPITGATNISVNNALTGLQSNTNYHYRIKATNAVNITYSNDMSFKTGMSIPQLTTTSINSITGISALSGGNVTYDGGSFVTGRGVCWSSSPTPTLSNSFSSNGTGASSFSSNITSLAIGTTYYVRAYATNAYGTAYGNEISFRTVALPIVVTTGFSDIRGNSAKAGGSVSNDGGSAITSQGLCWSTNTNPTIANSKTTSFTDVMSGLLPNTTYYVRAYATNIAGTGYGAQISFNSGWLIGSNYEGGIVFYNNGTGHGLVCAESDQSTAASWGCYGTAIGSTLTAISTGATNTNNIVAVCSTEGTAAKICYDLVLNTYIDWYLPSKDELKLMYDNLKTQNIGGFANDYYWSSSERDGSNYYAWTTHFGNPGWTDISKDNARYVRAVRSF